MGDQGKTYRETLQANPSKRFVLEEFLEFFHKGSIVDIALGDHLSKEMTIMFTDIRHFTTISEKMTYRQVFDFVNSYYEQVSPIIRQHLGFIFKYMGDGIMALFPNQADDAVQAGITKLRCVNEYNEHRFEKEIHRFELEWACTPGT